MKLPSVECREYDILMVQRIRYLFESKKLQNRIMIVIYNDWVNIDISTQYRI